MPIPPRGDFQGPGKTERSETYLFTVGPWRKGGMKRGDKSGKSPVDAFFRTVEALLDGLYPEGFFVW